MRQEWKLFFYITIGVFIGTLAALAIAAKYAEAQVQASSASNPLLSELTGL